MGKKKRDFLKKYFFFDTFCQNVWLLIGNEEKTKRFLKKEFEGYQDLYSCVDSKIRNGIGGVCFCDDRSNSFYIWLSKWTNKTSDISTLCHEIFHLVTRGLGQLGMELCIESDEAYAYLYSHITFVLMSYIYANQVVIGVDENDDDFVEVSVKQVEEKKDDI